MKTADKAIADLIRVGAAVVVVPGGAPTVAGLFQRIAPDRWFWWEAGGVNEFAGHVIEAEKVEVVHDGLAVMFTVGGKFAGYVTTLAEAYDEPEEIEAAVRQLKEWHALHAKDAALRGFIVRQMKAR